MAELFRYAAFISYSSKDAAFARRLHRAFESYGIPSSLGKFDLIGAGKKNRIYPVFRDREELAAGELGERIEAALRASSALVVVCSPHAARSPWVQKEIEFFLRQGRRERVFAIIADSAPLLDAQREDATTQLFPPAFRGHVIDDAGALEPLAADARRGKDGFRNAWLKVVAGLIGVTPGQLIDRDRKRRARRRLAIAAGLAAATAIAGLAAAAVDAQAWRTRLSSYAELAMSQGRALDALPFALAGEPGESVLLSMRGDHADAVLARLGATRIAADLGALQAMRLSARGESLVTLAPNAEGTARLYDLAALKAGQAPAPFEMGALGQPDVGGFLLSANGRTLIAGDAMAEGGRKAYDLAAIKMGAPQVPVELGISVGIRLSADGTKALSLGSDGLATLADIEALKAGRADARVELGDLGSVTQLLLSTDGSRLVVRAPGGSGRLIDVEAVKTGRGAARIDIGPLGDRRGLRDLRLSSDGRILFLLDYDDEGALIDLDAAQAGRAGARTPLGNLHAYWGHAVSGDGKTLVTQSEDLKGAVYDLGRAGARADLGDLGKPQQDFLLSDDGTRLAIIGKDNRASLIDLRAAKEGRTSPRIELGEVGEAVSHGAVLSRDGRFLVVVRKDRTGVSIDLDRAKAGGPDAHRGLGDLGELTKLLDSIAISHDGAALVARSSEGTWTLYDLSHPVWPRTELPQGAGLARAVCEASAQALRPFPEAVRGAAEAGKSLPAPNDEDERLFASLRGRPWNPCDWRGLLALLPDRRRGDGWLEGPRQWLRLIAVRYLGARDWSCEEATSKASAELRRQRRDMCARPQ
jgi:MTH538 TIR-like domain (DUF1863)